MRDICLRVAVVHDQCSQREDRPFKKPNALDQALGLIESLQDELTELKQQAAWSQRLETLGTVSATMAHEINNLLTPVTSYAQLALADLGDDQKTEKALEIAVENTKRIGRLTDAALGFASPADPPEANPTAKLSVAIDQALACVGLMLNRAGIEVLVKIEDSTLIIDPLALQQVLVNILTNAKNAMDGLTSTKKITISSHEQGGRMAIQILDTGPGVNEEIKSDLFEPFMTCPTIESAAANRRFKQTSGVGSSGSGLGLSICRDLIRGAGGEISLADSPGGGACFQISLPTLNAQG